ncbi:unnamed protein product [Cylindrotheca closterium]|uniref:Phytanoyl-CoA dioxygenase n=1 Tax=Cylindrotheca closterium TaxID=2856 RepID=A0AAD2CCW9_9STRA|nr:unnamed protein product [Cylindrotheca closterium]
MQTKSKRSHLSEEETEIFLRDGVLVVEDALTETEVQEALNELHNTLSQFGVKSLEIDDKESAKALQGLSSTNGSGGVLDIFYEDWKMEISTKANIFRMTTQLWKASLFDDSKPNHPYGVFDSEKGYAYIDRICYRLPTRLSKELGDGINKERKKRARPIQRSLTPHLDCCPDKMYKDVAKWRPLQCFVSLTDSLDANTGGFEAAKGFHAEFETWKSTRLPAQVSRKEKGVETTVLVPATCVGEYTHIRPREDREVMERVQHIPVSAGSVVFWDVRIPHANAYLHNGTVPRAVVYCSFLPDIELNRVYVKEQLRKYYAKKPITDQWNGLHGQQSDEEESQQTNYQFSALGRKLMGIDPW